MRRLTKGPPPTNVSPPSQQQASLAVWGAAYQVSAATAADPSKHARSKFDDMHKRYLRDLLFVEQRYLCVYCERAIDEVQPPPPIDHWNPLSLFLHQVFDWNNLHLSCRTVDTCDDRKKSVELKLPWPVSFQYEDVLGFTSGGRMYVRADVAVPPQLRQALELALEDQPGPPVARSTLNLNQPALREARAAAIEAEEGVPPTTPAQQQQRVAALLAQPRRDDFISARLAYLNGQLGVGR
ncbi:hypothetical protein [Myxococcus hansupus]|uniref:hypothetical protein n=1 Tax=Pseudomyxococcus hansupus TaxID=1297742 RepID=UPI000ADE4CE7|nr:hypothetical protein [Myxococcus hansupus]